MRISVGISAYNEEKTIAQALRCALESAPRVQEVIVVASGCTDRTVPIVKQVQHNDRRVHLLVEAERRGKASAVNKILRAARGDVIVLTDADVWFDKHAISNLLKPLREARVGAVTGRPQYYVTSVGSKSAGLKERMFDWWGKLASRAYDFDRSRKALSGQMFEVSGYLYAVRKGIVRGIPLFARSEDAFVGKQVLDAGFKVGYARDALVWARYPDNFKDFFTQKARTRYGHLEVLEALARERGAGVVERPRAAGLQYLKVAAELVKAPAHFFFAMLYPFAELIAWALALLRFNFGVREPWKQIVSTKVERIYVKG